MPYDYALPQRLLLSPAGSHELTSEEHEREAHRRYPVLVGTREIYQGRVINVRVDEIEVPAGIVRREVVEHPGAVVIVPIAAEGRILWITQHRWAAQRELLELPAGTL